jgi:hypothetical protein
MRNFLLLLLTISALSGYELIYISNDTSQENLNTLQQTYKQTLLVNDKKVYLIPSDCRLERYFGGASQLPVQLSQDLEQTQKITVTQEVFEAKDESIIKEKIEVEKSIALVEGKVAKAFLDDKEGRGYGGASQVPLDFSFQKIAAKKVHMKATIGHKPIVASTRPYQHPSCQLLDDGSGYQLQDIKDAYLYSDQDLHPISSTTILFN